MGGGAIRTAANAAFGWYRSTAVRRVPATHASTVHVAIDGQSAPLIAAISSENAPGHLAMVQRPACDDWEFAGDQDYKAVAVLDPPPRLVFGPAPTFEEATEAVADLKEAIDEVYSSSGNAKCTAKVNEISDIGGSSAICPSMPKHVVQVFSLLQRSPEAQSVVASLACDQNVWDAVMKNDKVLEFYRKHASVIHPPERNDALMGDNLGLVRLFSETVESPDEETSGGSSFFINIVQSLQTIKLKVSKMVGNISCFLQDFMGAFFENHGTANTKTSTSFLADHGNLTVGASFMALAVLTILVIFVKRG